MLQLRVKYTYIFHRRRFIHNTGYCYGPQSEVMMASGLQDTSPAYCSVIRTASREHRVRNPSCKASRAPPTRIQLERWITEGSAHDNATVTAAAADCQKALTRFPSDCVSAVQGVMAVTPLQAPVRRLAGGIVGPSVLGPGRRPRQEDVRHRTWRRHESAAVSAIRQDHCNRTVDESTMDDAHNTGHNRMDVT